MSESFAVNVNAVKLRFASAHMATLGKELEPLHGHNYIVSCTCLLYTSDAADE